MAVNGTSMAEFKFIFILTSHNFTARLQRKLLSCRELIWIIEMDNIISEHIFKVGIGLFILLSFIVYGITKDMRLQKQLAAQRKVQQQDE